MNVAILEDEIQDYIHQHLQDDVAKLILKGSPFSSVSIQEIANQIESKKKSESKIPSWFSLKKAYFPNKISLEQSSSEITAKYKSLLVSGKRLIDITGGFGVDTFYFSKHFLEVYHCEINPELSTIVAHNYQQLNVKNCTFISGDGIAYLEKSPNNFDCIYIDPSRRNNHNEKVFLLKECLPNVPEILDYLFTKTAQILIKVSPLLDISSTINELQFVSEVHVVAVQNEVKELLFLLQKNQKKQIKIHTINILKSKKQEFNFQFHSQKNALYHSPLTYLYEPNAAILKSGGFEEVATEYAVFKLHKHSHLYTSNSEIDFPGRCFKILQSVPYNKKLLKKIIPENKANITVRNFPKTVAQIRNETKLKDGGNFYLFFTTDVHNNFICLLTFKC